MLILDENKKVVEIKRNFKPFTVWNSKEKGKYVVEIGRKEKENNRYYINQLIKI